MPWGAPLPDKLWEGLDVLAAAGASLAEAIDAARAAGDCHIGLDGILIPTARERALTADELERAMFPARSSDATGEWPLFVRQGAQGARTLARKVPRTLPIPTWPGAIVESLLWVLSPAIADVLPV